MGNHSWGSQRFLVLCVKKVEGTEWWQKLKNWLTVHLHSIQKPMAEWEISKRKKSLFKVQLVCTICIGNSRPKLSQAYERCPRLWWMFLFFKKFVLQKAV